MFNQGMNGRVRGYMQGKLHGRHLKQEIKGTKSQGQEFVFLIIDLTNYRDPKLASNVSKTCLFSYKFGLESKFDMWNFL